MDETVRETLEVAQLPFIDKDKMREWTQMTNRGQLRQHGSAGTRGNWSAIEVDRIWTLWIARTDKLGPRGRKTEEATGLPRR